MCNPFLFFLSAPKKNKSELFKGDNKIVENWTRSLFPLLQLVSFIFCRLVSCKGNRGIYIAILLFQLSEDTCMLCLFASINLWQLFLSILVKPQTLRGNNASALLHNDALRATKKTQEFKMNSAAEKLKILIYSS